MALSDEKIIEILDAGIYVLNEQTNELFRSRKNGEQVPIKFEKRTVKSGSCRYRAELCYCNVRRKIEFHRLVWLKYTKTPIPKNFEIHHLDGNSNNNNWNNLVCVHKLDHKKFHKKPDTMAALLEPLLQVSDDLQAVEDQLQKLETELNSGQTAAQSVNGQLQKLELEAQRLETELQPVQVAYIDQ